MGTRTRLKLREKVADMGFHRLLREEEALADLAVRQALGGEFGDLGLLRRQLLNLRRVLPRRRIPVPACYRHEARRR